MFNEDDLPLLADGNSAAARRARVALQPRDKYGRWVTTGARLFAALKLGGGRSVNIRGNAIGGTDKPGQIRMLVGKGYEHYGISPNTVLTVDSKNGELFTGATLDKNFLKSKGIDPDVKHTLPADLANQPQSLKDMNPQPADALDVDLATNGLSPEEDKSLKAERDKQPLAELPPAMDVATGSEVSDIVNNTSGGDSNVIGGDAVDGAVKDAFGDAFYGDSVPTIDQLVDKASTPQGAGVKLTPTSIADLKPNDIVILQGKPMKVLSTKQRTLTDGWDLFVDDGNNRGPVNVANPKDFPSGIPGHATLQRIDRPAAPAAPAKPVANLPAADAPNTPDANAPTAAPAAPATPKAVTKPAAKPKKATAPKKTIPTIAKGRQDDGQDIPRNITPGSIIAETPIAQLFDDNGNPLFKRDNKGKKAKVEDPNAIYNALLEQNPQAKVDKTGHIILERGDFTDKDGKTYKYEVAVAKTHGNQYMQRFTFTDATTGESQSFYHYDYKDSLASIYSDSNGVEKFRDIMLGEAKPGGKDTPEKNHYFGDKSTLAKRIMFYRGKHAAGKTITDDMLDDSNFKLLTPEEVVRKYLNGRAEKLNMSGKAKGTKLQSFVGSAWEAIANDDSELFQERMVQLLGRLPDNEESRNLLVNTLRDQIKAKFNGTPQGRKLAPLANNLEKAIMSDGLDLRDIQRRPWASMDGKTIVKVGDKVRYWNNVGDWSIGEVVKLRSPLRGYDDIVAIKFSDGTQNVIRAKYVEILGDGPDLSLNMHDKDSALTPYKGRLEGDALRAHETRAYALDFGDAKRQDDDNAAVAPSGTQSNVNQNAAQPYLGSDGQDNSQPDTTAPDTTPAQDVTPSTPQADETPAESNIGELQAGDAWYNADGDYLGTFVEAQKVTADDGTEAWAVIYLDESGDEQLEIVDLGESRLPK